MKRKLFSAALAALVFLSLAPAAAAETWKDEIIYARLQADGTPETVLVVNAFEAGETAQVTDLGDYAAVLPLGQAEKFAYQDGQAVFTMGPGRFSYQGEPENKELPWNFSIRYQLDGKEIKPKALRGAQGNLEGRIAITVNENLRAFADSLSLQVTLTLDSERSFNIAAEKATLAVAGGNRTLSFVVLPGQNAEYTFTAEVKDFSMPAIQAAGVRMGMDAPMYQNAAAKAMAGSPLEGAVSSMMGNFLASMQGQKPVSFTNPGNTVRLVQFVIMVDGIPEMEKPEESPTAAESESFWQRLKGLLGL